MSNITSECMFKLMKAFPNSMINSSGEFIAHREANEYFRLEICENDFEVKCKVLEWLSRGACKTQPFNSDLKNRRFNDFMRDKINNFLDTNFSKDDMETIYQFLGNSINRQQTELFINSSYDMGVLK